MRNKRMRIAYYVAIHHKFYQFRWLIDAIYNREDIFLIHVDSKSSDEFFSNVSSYLDGRLNVRILQRRSVTWGGWSSVSVELQAMKTLLSSDKNWDYLINLSGQDYPIKSAESIKNQLQFEWPKNFIRAWSFAKVQQLEPHDPHLKRILAFDVFGRLVRTPIQAPFPKTIDIKFKGSAWHILTRDFCEWVTKDPIAERIAKLLMCTWNPDELYFPVAIMNSPFKDLRTEDYAHEILWPGPKTLRIEDYEVLSRSQALFARKFDSAVDRRVLLRLARDHGYSIPQDDDHIREGAKLFA